MFTKTFEHSFNLHSKSPSIDEFLSLPNKSRIFYRINHEKLQKYHQENSIPSINILSSNKIIHQKTISTQTTFNTDLNSSIHSSTNTLSTLSNGISESNISIDFSDEIQPPKSLYIRSIVRHMFGDDLSDAEQD